MGRGPGGQYLCFIFIRWGIVPGEGVVLEPAESVTFSKLGSVWVTCPYLSLCHSCKALCSGRLNWQTPVFSCGSDGSSRSTLLLAPTDALARIRIKENVELEQE